MSASGKKALSSDGAVGNATACYSRSAHRAPLCYYHFGETVISYGGVPVLEALKKSRVEKMDNHCPYWLTKLWKPEAPHYIACELESQKS